MGADQGLTDPDRLFYDGGCGLCHRAVRFLMARDPAGAIRFAPLGGETFLRTVPPERQAALPDSLVVQTSEGRILVRTAAAARLLWRLGGGWRLLERLGRILPRTVTDRLYDFVARHRRRWFPAPSGSCPLLPAELRDRFDP